MHCNIVRMTGLPGHRPMEERISGPTARVEDRHGVGTQQEAIVRQQS
jgi:hypothetical protein